MVIKQKGFQDEVVYIEADIRIKTLAKGRVF